jgi:hypothetical protein
MKTTLKCKISLSKKMRNLLQDGGSVVLTADSINSGKGEGYLTISDNGAKDLDLNEIMSKETSIMITPVEVSTNDPQPSVTNIYSDAAPQPHAQSPGVSNVFNQNASPPSQNSPRNVVDRMAATAPPEHGNNNTSYYSQDELTVPKAFDSNSAPDFMSHINSPQELFEAVNQSKDKDSGINVAQINKTDSMHIVKQKALLLEEKEMLEGIGCAAYVVNEKCASLEISDLGVSLGLNMPKNLGHISAKRLSGSRELWNLFKTGAIRLVSPNEADHLLRNAAAMNATYVPGLEIYDSSYDANEGLHEVYSGRRGGGGGGGGQDFAEATVIDLDHSYNEGYDETEAMSNLRTANASTSRRPSTGGEISNLSGGTRRTFHGSAGNEGEALHVTYAGSEFAVKEHKIGRDSKINEAGLKTVASRHSHSRRR